MEEDCTDGWSLGGYMRMLRRRAGLSQSALAAKIDVRQGTISSVERGVRVSPDGGSYNVRLPAIDLAGAWVEATQATPEECRQLLLLAAQTARIPTPRAA